MVEITVRGKSIDTDGRLVKGDGVTFAGDTLYDATRRLEAAMRAHNPKRTAIRLTPPNQEPGSSIATATLVVGYQMVGDVVIDFDA